MIREKPIHAPCGYHRNQKKTKKEDNATPLRVPQVKKIWSRGKLASKM